jgi:hypothetical protein
MTFRSAAAALVVSLAILAPRAASAGPYSDELSKCMVKSTTVDDKNLLMKWMFAGAAMHPAVRSIAAITDTQRDELSRSVAEMFQRLMTDSCKTEAQDAVKFEGAGALRSGFQVLGQAASVGLFSDPNVATFMSGFTKYMDKDKMTSVLGPAPPSH